jgi:hypothetical protein
MDKIVCFLSGLHFIGSDLPFYHIIIVVMRVSAGIYQSSQVTTNAETHEKKMNKIPEAHDYNSAVSE